MSDDACVISIPTHSRDFLKENAVLTSTKLFLSSAIDKRPTATAADIPFPQRRHGGGGGEAAEAAAVLSRRALPK